MQTSLLWGWITPEALATYLVGLIAIGGIIWQLKRTFVLNKKSAVFDELSKDIKKAVKLVNSVNTETNSILQLLASAADSASYDTTGKTAQQNETEIKRRIEELGNVADSQKKHIKVIYDSYENILEVIQKVEQSTVINKLSKKAARYLFYQADEQFQFVQAANKVLQSFKVVPPLGDAPNISPDTFKAFSNLVSLISIGNQKMSNYLSDLEVILHNDLVRKLFKKATIANIPAQHLTTDGFKDNRTEKPLI